MAHYEELSEALSERMKEDLKSNRTNPYAFDESNALRRDANPHDAATVWRPAFIRDADKILNCPYYSRCADKTQVFSLYRNDDITRRSLHIQLVARTARTIGRALGLNCELIEAIALGHDIGHTPFGHTGERFLDELYFSHTGLHFAHNLHSVRVLDEIFPLNLTLQTLDGIADHNGELELDEYKPAPLAGFEKFNERMQACQSDLSEIKKLVPSTLEGCVVRISDIIAYLGKDRHDAEKSKALGKVQFADLGIGTINAEIVNNLMVNLIENSYFKPFLKLDDAHFAALRAAKRDNYDRIYFHENVTTADDTIRAMMDKLYERLLKDLTQGNQSSPIFRQHIDYLDKPYYNKHRRIPYPETEKNRIVTDYIASMTDDYFVDLYACLFPDSTLKLDYVGYFDGGKRA